MKRTSFTTIFLAGALLLFLCTLRAMSAELSGTVTDPEGKPLVAVSVITNLQGVGTKTDDNGHFTLAAGDDITRLTFSCVGYQSRQFKSGELPGTVVLSPIFYRGADIVVTADRAKEGVTPVSFANFSKADIERDYTVGEFPLLLESTPNLYSYADAGSALGYSYMRIRGFTDKQVSTYINGVPLNDPEDQATYFVDLPDFASTVTDIQVQRGIGNSLYGDASFGGTVNIVTNSFARPRQVTLSSGYGEYYASGDKVAEISKRTIEYASGLIDGRWELAGRYSQQRSGGYRENSWYSGWAYYFSVARLDPRMTTELHLYGGPMRMHLAYYGTPRSILDTNRRYNYLSYNNETDNFNQPHYQLHNVYRLSDKSTLANTLYYIRGSGYYEQLKSDASFDSYNIDSTVREIDTSTGSAYSSGDVVRQQWVDKNQIGWNPRLDIEHAKGTHSFGGSLYKFDSDHWGQVVFAQHLTGSVDPRHRYYQYSGSKWVGSLFAQEFYRLTDKLSAQGALQFRYQRYKFDQTRMGAFKGYQYTVDWTFLSPRLGLTFAITPEASLYASVASSSRTPTDAEIYDAGDPDAFPSLEIKSRRIQGNDTTYVFGHPTFKSERVWDLELGSRYEQPKYVTSVNLFWMDFRDEIIPLGGINPNTGIPITINADRSVHAGLELAARVKPIPELSLSGNWSANYNRVKSYSQSFSYELDSLVMPVSEDTTVSFKNKTIAGFPSYLANFVADYQRSWLRLTWRTRWVGRQWMELQNIEALSTDPFSNSSLTLALVGENFLQLGRATLSITVDNVFNAKYETSGYGGDYAYRNINESAKVDGWAEYYVGPERNWYAQLQLELF